MTLACNRRLAPSAKVQLVFGKGVSTPPLGNNAAGVPNSVEKRFNFQVREPFAATFSCERENAQSACLPIRPMRLSFNAPVPVKLLQGIRLVSAKETLKPTLGGDGEGGQDDDHVLNSVTFPGLFAEQTAFTLELPKGFKDASGRSLRNADSFPLKVATGAMPPLAKFAAAPFGIVERFAEPNGVALLPVTLRNVEAALSVQGPEPRTARQGQHAEPHIGCRHHGLVCQGAQLRQLQRVAPPRRARRQRPAAQSRGEHQRRLDAVAHGVAAGWPGQRQNAGLAQACQQRPAPV